MHHGRITGRERTAGPLRLLLLLGNWTGGGAERVAVHLMNGFPALSPPLDVHLGLLHDGPAYRDQLDPARVHIAPESTRLRFDRPNRELFAPGTLLAGAVHAPRALRRMIAELRPDVVMSFLKGTSILTGLALGGLRQRPRWIIREGNNIRATANQESPNRLVRDLSLRLTRAAYRRADAILANASGMARDLPRQLGVDPARVHLINNPVDIAAVEAAARARCPALPRRPFILSVGRLEWQKGHDLLIRAFARSGAAATHDLVILGEGSRRAALARLVSDLQLDLRVKIFNFTPNPHAWMAAADVFVLPSRWEGFPNAAAEAMASGVPVILADCDYGATDLVAQGSSGLLVPVEDVSALTAALARLLSAPDERARLAINGQMRIRRFSRDRILERYAALVVEVAKGEAAALAPLSFAPA